MTLLNSIPDIVRRLRGLLAEWERDVDGQSLKSER